jgi:ABC-type transport system involved in multi-copper enzyme maturation permease subunit
MQKTVTIIAGYTFLEGLRNRVFGLSAVGLVCLFGLTEFVGDLAITESSQIHALFIGSGMRLFTVATVALFVITSMTREMNDKAFELILSLPVARSTYYFGKLLGYYALAFIMILLTGALLSVFVGLGQASVWALSLFCELGLVIAVSLLCLFTFSNVTVSFIVVMTFYFLARSIHAIQLISSSPILEFKTFSQEFMRFLVNAIAFLLPDLYDFTRSDWLVYGIQGHGLYHVLLQTAIYLPLLVAAGLFDLYRKDL